ncbi:MAG: DUF2520 domain-containing protein [Alicyclobacillus sp.]|nr:DUF2520 domain-containing protein [Alicyclobacillus sp.]
MEDSEWSEVARMERMGLVGPGKLGLALALTLRSIGCTVWTAVGRRPDSTSSQAFTSALACPVQPMDASSAAALRACDAIFLTTPDGAIEETAAWLADAGAVRRGQVVVHTAGSLGADVLTAAARSGALRLALHPLQAFAEPSRGPALFAGVYCTLEGDAEAVARGRDWVTRWNGVPVELSPDNRARYHAAAVLAAGGVTALAAVAAELAGLPDGVAPLLPLLRGALANLATLGLPTALTGPMDRGDTATVRRHIAALRDEPVALDVYLALGRVMVQLAAAKGRLSQRAAEELASILATERNPHAIERQDTGAARRSIR